MVGSFQGTIVRDAGLSAREILFQLIQHGQVRRCEILLLASQQRKRGRGLFRRAGPG